jgi:hypothetical protein
MREIPLPDRPERLPESSQEVFQGNRLTSLVYIMRERSPFSHLGILDFQAGSLSLRDAKGGQLFAVPAETVQARPPAGSSTRPSGRSMVVPGRVYHPGQVPAAVDTGTDRALPARELAPQPAGMSAETYLRLTSSPTKHQALWGGYWLGVLRRAGS